MPLAAPGHHGLDGSVYHECSTVCYRPGDCALAYSSGNICPAGFLCALYFHCVPTVDAAIDSR
jgi:hypothetical protein